VIVDLLERGGDLREEADVCVIGSGAGGAVVAAVLAEAGLSVVVLEQGQHHTRADFDQREETMLPRLFEEAGMRQTEDGSVTILQGRGIGGSTVHNLCYCFRAPPPVLRLWRERHGLPELTDEALAPSFERVEHGLGVVPIREDEVNALNRLVRRGAEKLGYSGFVAKHNRRGCVQSGYCLLGCSYDAKLSMLITYVPRADAAGARIYASVRARRIEADARGAHRVHAEVVDPTGTALGLVRVRSRVVVLAAGAIATPILLKESGLAGESGQVGRNLHLHPAVMAAGIFEEPFAPYRGIPQSYYIDEFIDLDRDPESGVILMPIAGFPGLTAANLPGFGREHFRFLRAFDRTAGLLALLHDRSAGEVEPGPSPARPRIRYRLDADDARALAEGLVHCAEVLMAAGAREVLIPYFDAPLVVRSTAELAEIRRRGVRQGAIPIASTHPQSTCRMGGDPATAVVDAFGECFHVPRLFVADMSVFPTSLGAPPQITTAALADRTAHHILARREELFAGS